MTEGQLSKSPSFGNALNNVRQTFLGILLYAFLILLAVILFFPVYYTAVLSTYDNKAIYSGTLPIFFSGNLMPNLNYLASSGYFFRSVINSSVVAVLATLSQIFFCTMCGFAFAKYEFRGKKILFGIVIATLMVPKLLFIIPMYKLMAWFHWIDTYLPLFVPDMANAFGIYLMYQYIKNLVPDALLEAGRMDGLSGFDLLFHVVFPVVTPGIAVLGTITFIGSWNNFQLALVMISQKEMYTIPISLFNLFGQYLSTSVLMLGIIISQIPLILGFLLFSRQIIKNMVAGSIKG